MNGDKKKNSEKKSVNSTNTMSKSLLSLKDIALGIEKTELNQQENSLSKYFPSPQLSTATLSSFSAVAEAIHIFTPLDFK